ncbi:MAG: T9SS type A sorting domain-containing protein [Bacteroidia bacterium]|nr:T9SS type A sorting domain-containing protein [Bacteroidia bacterium]MDW8133822.1 T9SS type A sorting domain-containing protein [Bacteroidia bacterium]
MKRVSILIGIAALVWAQQIQVPSSLPELRPRGVVQVSAKYWNSSHARTQSLGWLLPNQDFVIVPDPTNDPDYAGDTLISNGTGPNTRTNPPTVCVGTFFDSLDMVGAYILLGNERFKLFTVSTNPLGLCAFLDGAYAERYDISPDLGGTDRTVSIKGVAAWIVNISGGNPCAPTIGAPTPDNGDGEYTITYELYPARNYTWGSPFYTPSRQGTILGTTVVRSVSKPMSQVRIGNGAFGGSGPSCPGFAGNPPHIAEVFDFAYFPQPLYITDSASYYVVLRTERYNLNTFNFIDTLYVTYGPGNSGFNPANHPCYNADTVRIGRSLISWAVYDTVSGEFYDDPSGLQPTLPDWLPLHLLLNPPLDKGLNYVIFPIVYSQDLGTGVWIHGDRQSFMTPYPNPTTDCFHVKFRSASSSQVELHLYTTDGRWVKSWPAYSVPAGESQVVVDVTDVPGGTYVLRVRSELGQAAFQVNILR